MKANKEDSLIPVVEELLDNIIAKEFSQSGCKGADNMSAILVEFKH